MYFYRARFLRKKKRQVQKTRTVGCVDAFPIDKMIISLLHTRFSRIEKKTIDQRTTSTQHLCEQMIFIATEMTAYLFLYPQLSVESNIALKPITDNCLQPNENEQKT